jgi:hypothetical protein
MKFITLGEYSPKVFSLIVSTYGAGTSAGENTPEK